MKDSHLLRRLDNAIFSCKIYIARVASVSVGFRSKQRPRNGILGFGRALSLTPSFARSLTLVPRSLLQNRTETLATQAKIYTFIGFIIINRNSRGIMDFF